MRVLSRVATVVIFAAVLVGIDAPARAHARVFIQGVFPVPLYPVPLYPAPYPVYSYPPYPYAYPYAISPAVPPPGWETGHWEWRKNRWGRRVEVWIPPHLR